MRTLLCAPLLCAPLLAPQWRPIPCGDVAGARALLFANTRSTSKRVNVTLAASLDAGATWPARLATRVSGPGGYVDVQFLPGAASDGERGVSDDARAEGGAVGDAAAVLFEKDTCDGIALAVVSLPKLV